MERIGSDYGHDHLVNATCNCQGLGISADALDNKNQIQNEIRCNSASKSSTQIDLEQLSLWDRVSQGGLAYRKLSFIAQKNDAAVRPIHWGTGF